MDDPTLTPDDRALICSALRLLSSCARSDAADAEHVAARGHHNEAHVAACMAETCRDEAERADVLRDRFGAKA